MTLYTYATMKLYLSKRFIVEPDYEQSEKLRCQKTREKCCMCKPYQWIGGNSCNGVRPDQPR